MRTREPIDSRNRNPEPMDPVAAETFREVSVAESEYVEREGSLSQSTDYDGTDVATGDATKGWRSEADGSAEYNDVRIRGELAVAVVTGDVTLDGTGRFESAPDGTVPRVVVDSSGLGWETVTSTIGPGVAGTDDAHPGDLTDTPALNLSSGTLNPGDAQSGVGLFPESSSSDLPLIVLNAGGGVFLNDHAVPSVLNTGAPVDGAATPALGPGDNHPVYMQGGKSTSTVISSDSHEITLPTAFPNGLLTFTAFGYTTSAGPGLCVTTFSSGGVPDKTTLRFRVWRVDTGAKVTTAQTIMWTAWGW